MRAASEASMIKGWFGVRDFYSILAHSYLYALPDNGISLKGEKRLYLGDVYRNRQSVGDRYATFHLVPSDRVSVLWVRESPGNRAATSEASQRLEYFVK